MSTGDSPPVFKTGARQQVVENAMKKTDLVALKAAVQRSDMFDENFGEKDPVSSLYKVFIKKNYFGQSFIYLYNPS